MIKARLIALIAALAVILGGVSFTASPASADTSGCVSKKEYKAVETGWTKAHVKRVFDTGGAELWHENEDGYLKREARQYRPCAGYIRDGVYAVVVIFKKKPHTDNPLRVELKSLFGG